MIPRISISAASDALSLRFIERLSNYDGFGGEISSRYSTRLINATDNSVYQTLPQAVIFPRSSSDIEAIFMLANQHEEFHALSFAARGGGTGTNGQSLTTGIIIDCSKYLTRILELNLDEGWVTVEPGVILDQLNQYLKPHSVFFAPSLSPSNRATIGGMVNTDACGKGSSLYGRTSNHVVEITAVYSDGSVHCSHAMDQAEWNKMKQQDGRIGSVYRQVGQTVNEHQATIERVFPKMQRFMTGYNLAHVHKPGSNQFNLNAVITGSEGTLAVVTKVKLKLTPMPKCKCLLVRSYSSFDDALQDGLQLLKEHPSAIETIDEYVLALAKTDRIYQQIGLFIGSGSSSIVAAINLIEFVADNEQTLREQVSDIDLGSYSTHQQILFDDADMSSLWELRKKCVALLGKSSDRRKVVSCVEDTVVPPEKLPEYVKEFRDLLNGYHLSYGMFGHVDAGCLHIRPALDLTKPDHQAILFELSDKVALLTKKYGGYMWGEHGKGYRSSYVPLFFEDQLYVEMQKIKASFDPNNQLNPGKVATPLDNTTQLLSPKSVMRADLDREIADDLRDSTEVLFSCNGNATCFNRDQNDFMCPSYKATNDRRQSPKGRAALMREWLRKISIAKKVSSFPLRRVVNQIAKLFGLYDYSHEVNHVMRGCLGCKACAIQCPVNVNIPLFRAKFLEQYHSRYLRSLGDYFIARGERLARLQHSFPSLSRAIMCVMNPLLKKIAGLVDLPQVVSSKCKIEYADGKRLSQLSDAEKSQTIVIVQDWLSRFYEPQLLFAYQSLLSKLGYQVFVLPFLENGRTFYEKGYLKKFKKIAARTSWHLQSIAQTGVTMIGIDPSMVLTLRNEYVEILGVAATDFKVQLLQEHLHQRISLGELSIPVKAESDKTYVLMGHCTEVTSTSMLAPLWQSVFEAFGLNCRMVATGCCGMAGAYGHEVEHPAESQRLFSMSWRPVLEKKNKNEELMATGYSCRSQIHRLTKMQVKHPAELLNALLP